MTAPQASATDPTRDRSSLASRAFQSIAVVAGALSLFAAADAWQVVTGFGFASALAAVDGLLVGAGLAALAHEWGHFAGARLGGGVAPLTSGKRFLPLYDFDFARSDARAFDWMSVGGNLAHWSVPLLLAITLPLTTPGRVALVCGAVGFAVFASVTEFPVIARTRGGEAPLQALARLTPDLLRRNAAIGFGAAVALGLVL